MASVTLTIPRNVENLAAGFTKKDKRRALGVTVLAIGADVEKYAPSSRANTGPGQHYIRGRGTQLVSGRNLNNSERMSVKWDQKVSASGDSATITNTASYSPYVIGKFQRRFHAERGWINIPKHIEDKGNANRFGEIYFNELLRGKV